METLDSSKIHTTWRPLVKQAIAELDPLYVELLNQQPGWLPGPQKVFNAFTIPLSQIDYILFGESPYPRMQSAIGFAFWDGAVHELWSVTGLAPAVNRATSLRNIIKMLLIAKGHLSANDTSQAAIAALDKSHYVKTIDELFGNILDRGILPLNATLVFRKEEVRKHALAWRPFMAKLLEQLAQERPHIELILLGKIAEAIDSLPAARAFKKFYAEHPYNLSFIYNKKVQDYFRPFRLLETAE